MKSISTYLSKRLPALALGSALILAATALAFTQKPAAKTEPKTTPVNLALDERPVSRDTAGRASFAPVIKKVSPGVVRVFTTVKAQKTGFSGGADMNDLMRRFFGDQFQGRMPKRDFGMPRQEGVGSGVIVTKDGYILTNNHVVDGADEVKVALQDGREFTAKVIGRDPKSDVAVIKIDAKDLPAVPMADSDKVEVGDVVLAIGNPFGIGQTVTTGIVSATGRGNMGLDYEDFIQTDAAINPGNSGGALVDADGRLVGINTAILSRSGGNQGIGFAIPVNLARDVMDSLIKDGHVTRGYLGVMIQDLTPALAKEFKLKDDHRRARRRRHPERPGGQSRPQERRRAGRVQWQESHRQPPPQARSGPHPARPDCAGEDPARWHGQDPRGHREDPARHRRRRQGREGQQRHRHPQWRRRRRPR